MNITIRLTFCSFFASNQAGIYAKSEFLFEFSIARSYDVSSENKEAKKNDETGTHRTKPNGCLFHLEEVILWMQYTTDNMRRQVQIYD